MKPLVWGRVDDTITYYIPCNMCLGVGQALCVMETYVFDVYQGKKI